jgi:hypothetical protein
VLSMITVLKRILDAVNRFPIPVSEVNVRIVIFIYFYSRKRTCPEEGSMYNSTVRD